MNIVMAMARKVEAGLDRRIYDDAGMSMQELSASTVNSDPYSFCMTMSRTRTISKWQAVDYIEGPIVRLRSLSACEGWGMDGFPLTSSVVRSTGESPQFHCSICRNLTGPRP